MDHLVFFLRDKWITWCVREGVPDGRPAAASCGHALDLVSRRRRPEHESLGERRPAQPTQQARAARRLRGTDACSSLMAMERRHQGKQQQHAPRRR